MEDNAANTSAKVRNTRTATKKPKKAKRDETKNRTSSKENNEDPFKMPVRIVRAMSPDLIYVSDPSNDETYLRMMSRMQIFYNKYEQVGENRDWPIDSLCAVYSTRDRSFCRARIIAIKDDKQVEVFLIDLAFTEIVPLSDLRTLKKKFIEEPTNAFLVKLGGISICGGSTTWPSKTCDVLEEIVTDSANSHCYISKFDNVDKKPLEVDLWVKQVVFDGPLVAGRYEVKSVNRMLVDQGVAIPMRQYDKHKPMVLAIELIRTITFTEEERKSENMKKLIDGKFARKGRASNGSIKKPKSDDDSVDSGDSEFGDSDADDDDTADETQEETFRAKKRNSHFSSSAQNLCQNSSSPQKITSWLPAQPILDNTFMGVVTYVDYNGYIYLYPKTQAGTVANIGRRLLEKYGNMEAKSTDYVWKTGDLCIAQYHSDKKWYRAIVCKLLHNGSVEVMFVDYGSIEECEKGTLRKQLDCVEEPRQVTQCSIYGLYPTTTNGQWLTKDLDFIHSKIVGTECEINVIKRNPDNLVVSITQIWPVRQDLALYLAEEPSLKIRADFRVPMIESLPAGGNDSTITGELLMAEARTEEKLNGNERTIVNIAENSPRNSRGIGKMGSAGRKKKNYCVENNNNKKNNDTSDRIKKMLEQNAFISLQDRDDTYSLDSTMTSVLQRNSSNDDSKNLTSSTIDGNMNSVETNGYCNPDIENDTEPLISNSYNHECISPTDTICPDDNELVTSTPLDASFEAVTCEYKALEIPGDVEVVKAEVSVICADRIFMHLKSNNNSAFLTEQCELYDKIMEDMQREAEIQPMLTTMDPDTPCCAKFSDGKWYRCRVVCCQPYTHEMGWIVKVYFVDFGNTCHVKHKDIRVMKDDWFKAYCMSFTCKLWGVIIDPAITAATACENIRRVFARKGRNSQECYVRIKVVEDDVYYGEIYNDEKCEVLAYASLIGKGLYFRVNDATGLE